MSAALHPLELLLIQRLATTVGKISAYASSDDRSALCALASLALDHFGAPAPVAAPGTLTVVPGGAA